MSQNFRNKSSDYDSSGPRPPVPGQEETRHKMTDNINNEQNTPSSSSSSSRSTSSPPCLGWALNLDNLLEDREGNRLFKEYVEQQGSLHINRLNFFYAIQGLKQQSSEIHRLQGEDRVNQEQRVQAVIRVIFRFISKNQIQLPDNVRRYAPRRGESTMISPNIFDQMQQDVVRLINETTYRSFLQSEMYIQYVRNSTSAIERGQAQPGSAASSSTTSMSSLTVSGSSSMFLSGSSTLPTLHEEGDGSSREPYDLGAVGGYRASSNRVPINSNSYNSKIPMSLTKDALMVTQHRRLERPPAAHGYNYPAGVSFNPVSRRDSEQASMSSGRTDSDTMSLASMSDGRQMHRRMHHHQSSSEKKQMNDNLAANSEIDRFISHQMIPRTQTTPPRKPPTPKELYEQLIPKLRAIEKDQEIRELVRRNLTEPEITKFDEALCAKLKQYDDKNDQDILDQHVTRVFETPPLRSPGNMSPSTNLLHRRKPHQESSVLSSGNNSQSSMRAHHSRSVPDSNLRKSKNFGSINTDSGISMFCSDTSTIRNMASSSCGSSSSRSHRTQMLPPETAAPTNTNKGQMDDSRRSKRHHQQPPLPQKTDLPPPLPAKNFSQPASSAASMISHTTEEAITVVCSYSDEEVPYRFKIPGKLPTLKQFKELLPRKGNFRFFFKKRCDDPDVPICNEEIHNDADALPLFDGKVMAQAKPGN